MILMVSIGKFVAIVVIFVFCLLGVSNKNKKTFNFSFFYKT